MSYFELLSCSQHQTLRCLELHKILSHLLILRSSICLGSGTLPHCAPAARMGHKHAELAAPTMWNWWIQESDSEGIRTPAGRAQWISSPSP